MNTKDARSLPPAAQERLRFQVVQAILGGMKQKEAAKLFGVTPQAVCGWMKRHRQEGSRALRAQKRGRPRSPRLLPWQSAQIVRTIADRHPEQLKLPFYLWTREAVAQLIEQRFGLKLSVWTVGRYLKRWGFTPQKPVRRAFEQDSQAVRRWLDEEYPSIRVQAKREKAEIYWGDEMGMRSDHQAGRSFGRRGQTPVIPGTGQRFRCNMISAITNRGRLNFMIFKQRFQCEVFLEFLRRLVRQSQRRVFLIVDGHPVHRSTKAKRWLKKHENEISLFFLPGYSPELNPDEHLNQDVKTNALGRRRPRNQKEMIGGARSYLRRRQRRPQLVRRYFQEKHVRYAA